MEMASRAGGMAKADVLAAAKVSRTRRKGKQEETEAKKKQEEEESRALGGHTDPLKLPAATGLWAYEQPETPGVVSVATWFLLQKQHLLLIFSLLLLQHAALR